MIVSNEFSSVETITETMFLRLRLQSVFPLITRTDDRPVLPVIINSLLAVVVFFLTITAMCFLYAKPKNLENFSIKPKYYATPSIFYSVDKLTVDVVLSYKGSKCLIQNTFN